MIQSDLRPIQISGKATNAKIQCGSALPKRV